MSATSDKPANAAENVAVECRCGKMHAGNLRHYERLLASCGKMYWALRPRRGGPLELHPWPGPNLTRDEYREKYGQEDD